MNTFGYVEGNPLSLHDSYGLAPGDLFHTQEAAAADAEAYYAENYSQEPAQSFWETVVYGGQRKLINIHSVGACWSYSISGPAIGMASPIGPRGPWKINKLGISGKEGAKGAPSWAKGQRSAVGESGKDFVTRILNQKYGSGNWSKGPGEILHLLEQRAS